MKLALDLLDPPNPRGAWAREHLATDIVGWLTTVTPDGTPQSSVVCFFWDGSSIIVYSRPDVPRMHNLATNPRVAFNLQSDSYGDHMLSIEGVAEPDPLLPPQDRMDAYLAKYRGPLAHWGMDPAETARDFSLPLRIRPTRIRTF